VNKLKRLPAGEGVEGVKGKEEEAAGVEAGCEEGPENRKALE